MSKEEEQREQNAEEKSDNETLNSSQNEMGDILAHETLPEAIHTGQLCRGVVVAVDDEVAYLDIGAKSEGLLPLSDLGANKPEKNEELEVKVVSVKGEAIRLSRSQVIVDRLRKELDVGRTTQGKINGKVKGGYTVSLGPGVDAFLPFSLSGNYNREEEALLDVESSFIVERIQKSEHRSGSLNIVLNRQKWLEQEIQTKRDEFFKTHNVGDIIKGVVKNYTSFGAFIDLGGFDGLLHLNDMAWGHPLRPRDFVSRGEELELKIVALDPEKQRINFSLKELQEDPWDNFIEVYHVGDVVAGQVTKLVDYGAFVSLGNGIEGLVHISELSWVKRFKHPSEVLNVGQHIEVQILAIETDHRRVSLGVRQTLDNPWDSIEERYPEGTVLKLKVKNIIASGAFFSLEEGIDGFLHAEDYSWTKRVRNMTSELEVDQELELVIIECDSASMRIRLGLKQRTKNPWEALEELGRGAVIEGVVVGKTDFGVFVRVEGDIDGLLHKFDLVESRQEDADQALANCKIGSKIRAAIQEVDVERGRLSLSIRAYMQNERKREVAHYMSNSTSDDLGTASIGDLLRQQQPRE